MANVSTWLIQDEIKQAKGILEDLEMRIRNGIPGEDGLPATAEVTYDFMRQLRGDLLIVANKCEGLANTLQEGAV